MFLCLKLCYDSCHMETPFKVLLCLCLRKINHCVRPWEFWPSVCKDGTDWVLFFSSQDYHPTGLETCRVPINCWTKYLREKIQEGKTYHGSWLQEVLPMVAWHCELGQSPMERERMGEEIPYLMVSRKMGRRMEYGSQGHSWPLPEVSGAPLKSILAGNQICKPIREATSYLLSIRLELESIRKKVSGPCWRDLLIRLFQVERSTLKIDT